MLIIPCIPSLYPEAMPAASQRLSGTPFYPIACHNWPELFPYAPEAGFQVAHNGEYLFIHFVVNEKYTMSRITEDNGEVWTDSCVEFFLALDDSGYYNFEFTPIGKMLLAFRKERPAATPATTGILNSIRRFPSLGNVHFGEKQLGHPWELTVGIPATALFKHNLKSWQGVEARVNVYKCGDKLTLPHYLSWSPVDTPRPDFHVARCFRNAYFE